MRNYCINILLIYIIFFSLIGCNPTEQKAVIISKPGLLQVLEGKKNIVFSKLLLGDTGVELISFRNDGSEDIYGLAFSEISPPFYFSGVEGVYPGDQGTCGSIIKIDEACTLSFSFIPDELGEKNDNVYLKYNDGFEKRKLQIGLKGNAVTKGELSFFPGPHFNVAESLDFGTLFIGEDKVQRVLIKNKGGLDIKDLSLTSSLSAPFYFTGGGYPGENGTCGTFLEGKQNCYIEILFRPASVGIATQVLNFSFNNGRDSGVLFSRTVSAKTKRSGGILASPQGVFYDFGDRAMDTVSGFTYIIEVINSGDQNSTNIVTSLNNISGGEFSIFSDSCSGLDTLAVSASCQVVVSFTPTNAQTALQSSELVIGYFDNSLIIPQARQLVYTLNGTGKTPALIVLDVGSDSLDFGRIEITKDLEATFLFRNLGEITASDFVVLPPAAPFELLSDGSDCLAENRTLISQDSPCRLKIRFPPTLVGAYNIPLTFNYNNGGNNVETVVNLNLQGVGITLGRISLVQIIDGGESPFIDGSTIDFKTTYKNNSKVFDFKLKNIGTGSAQMHDLSLALGFNYFNLLDNGINNCFNRNLLASQECEFQVSFSPNDIINDEFNFADAMSLKYDDGEGGGNFNKSSSFLLKGSQSLPADLALLEEGSVNSIVGNYQFPSTNPSQPKFQKFKIKGINLDRAEKISFLLTGDSEFSLLRTSEDCSDQFSLGKDESCLFGLLFNSPANATAGQTFNAQLDFNYENGNGQASSNVFTFSIIIVESGYIAFLDSDSSGSPVPQYQNALFYFEHPGSSTDPSVFSDKNYALKNTGTNSISNINIVTPLATYYSITNNTCPSSLSAGSECSFTLRFNPTSSSSESQSLSGKNIWETDLKITYTTVSGNDENIFRIGAKSLAPANLVALDDDTNLVITENNFGEVPQGLSKLLKLAVHNFGEVSTEPITVTLSDSVNYVFDSENSCIDGVVLGEVTNIFGRTCVLAIRFRPSAILEFPEETITIGYGAKTVIIKLNGIGVEAISTFNNWVKINAISDTIQTNVTLEWEGFTIPNGFTIDSYNIYRSEDKITALNLDNAELTAHFSGSDATVFTETIALNKTYYYGIRVVISDIGLIELKSNEVHSIIKLTSPPRNMALVHRLIANSKICLMMGNTNETLLNDQYYSCFGGKKYDSFDIGYNYYVDLYESSLQGSVQNKLPINRSQNDAISICGGNNISFGPTNLSINKRLPNRIEQFIASIGTLKSNCNISTNFVSLSGSFSSCVSDIGAFDMVGNLWEWSLDIFLGLNAVQNGSYPANAPYNQLFLNESISHGPAAIEDITCVAVNFGMPIGTDDNTCPLGATLVSTLSVADDFFYSATVPTIENPVASANSLTSGGAFNSGSEAGIWSVDIRRGPNIDTSELGLRCVLSE